MRLTAMTGLDSRCAVRWDGLLSQFSEPRPGLFVLSVLSQTDLLPEHQGPLLKAVELALEHGRASIVFQVDAGVRSVPMNVPTFWLGVTSRLRLAGIAIVTESTVVRLAARGFGAANRLRGIATPVEVFATVAEALTWLERAGAGPSAR